ncbi:MAG: malic enzyme-like NAD(P)-binding protein [Pseudomonadota bacterium]
MNKTAGAARDFAERALAFGREGGAGHGKIEILPTVRADSLDDMAVAYTPGVGHVVRHVLAHPDALEEQTARGNMIALVSNGTAVLGLGNVGPRAAIPVMEGKAVMFKSLAGLDCMPLCIDAEDTDRFCDVVAALEPTFSGINLEDVAAPQCFDIMARLEADLAIPIFHDDQFGTATVLTAGVINALAATGRTAATTTAVVNGCGAAGSAAITMLDALGIGDIIAVDRKGIVSEDDQDAPPHWRAIARRTNKNARRGTLADALKGADLFVGLSTGGLVNAQMVRSMARDPLVFALANPEPEINPAEAITAGAAVAASGRFDAPNHCNNVLAFPGIMRGAVEVRAKRITPALCLTAAKALAAHEGAGDGCTTPLLPSPLDLTVHATGAAAIAQDATAEGLASRQRPKGTVYGRTLTLATAALGRVAHLHQTAP